MLTNTSLKSHSYGTTHHTSISSSWCTDDTLTDLAQALPLPFHQRKVFHPQHNIPVSAGKWPAAVAPSLYFVSFNILKILEDSLELNFWCLSSVFEERGAIQEICLHVARRLLLLCDKAPVPRISKLYFHNVYTQNFIFSSWILQWCFY